MFYMLSVIDTRAVVTLRRKGQGRSKRVRAWSGIDRAHESNAPRLRLQATIRRQTVQSTPRRKEGPDPRRWGDEALLEPTNEEALLAVRLQVQQTSLHELQQNTKPGQRDL